MISYDEKTLRRLQLTELKILKEADRICRLHDIPYCIIAGTLLGAVRHQGFIPWDDDADIALFRKDYDRFVEACKKDLKEDFCFQDHNQTKGYRWGYGKLRYQDSLFLREHQEDMPYHQGVFIDVFPLDNVSDHPLIRKLEDLQCFLLRKILYSPVGCRYDRSLIKRILYYPLSLINEDKAKRMLNGLILSKRKDSGWVRILMFPTPNGQKGYHKSWYSERADYVFEGEVFPGIRDYDAYLTFKYGDYRKLPPVEERKIHPVSALRLPEEDD